jgi:hypothetical protein
MRIAAQSALATGFILPLSLVLAFGLGGAVAEGLPGHMAQGAKVGLAGVVALAVFSAGGALWGRVMAGITGLGGRRMVWAGALSFGPAVMIAAIALSLLEVVIVERGAGPDLPIHILFTWLFVPAATFVAGSGGFGLGSAYRNTLLAGRAALLTGLAGGLAFLAVNLIMDSLGWRVGAPGAAERATMLTVLLTGSLAAALAGGATLGLVLRPHVSPGRLPAAV